MSKDISTHPSDVAHVILYVTMAAAVIIFLLVIAQLILDGFNSDKLTVISAVITSTFTAIIAYANYKSALSTKDASSINERVLQSTLFDRTNVERKEFFLTSTSLGKNFNLLHQNNRVIIIDLCGRRGGTPEDHLSHYEKLIKQSELHYKEIEEAVNKLFELIHFFELTFKDFNEEKFNSLRLLLSDLINKHREQQSSFIRLINRVKNTPNPTPSFAKKGMGYLELKNYIRFNEEDLLNFHSTNRDGELLIIHEESVISYLNELSDAIKESNSEKASLFTDFIIINEKFRFDEFEKLYKVILKEEVFSKV